MKKNLFIIIAATIALFGCGSGENGQLIGVQDRVDWYPETPFGMVFIHQGSFHMGGSDQDAAHAFTNQMKTVSVSPFFMDETEITNNEWRQFVYYTRDSIARRILGENGFEEDFFNTTDEYDQEIDPPTLIWKTKIEWDDQERREYLEEMFIPENERFYRKREFDARKLNYEYYWIDLISAARKSNRQQGLTDRSVFVKKDIVNVYPDTLAWIHDFTYSYNEPLTNNYFWHPAYDHYPVVGITWRQARAFSIWRTLIYNQALESSGQTAVDWFRLPTETEWEYAARGGRDLASYPWGGYYIRNNKGCFLGNYKPLRGNYTDDGGIATLIVGHYHPNDFNLFDMAGNVAEWTSNAFDESAYNFIHDMNPNYFYEAEDTDAPARKRKVLRGGSWKDVGMYLQNGTRTYEYQDTAKCYIGFRNVMTFLGRDINDNPANASSVY